MPESVVRLPLGGVLEDLVGFLDRSELRGRVRVVVQVGVVLLYLLPERGLDLRLRSIFVDIEEVVEVKVVCHMGRRLSLSGMGAGFKFAMLGVALEV